jgi:hypothetical protein
MSVVVELNPEIEEALKKKAEAQGSKLAEYVAGVLEKHVDLGPTYEEIMAPLWKDFEESGMTDEELDELVERERQAVWEEKHGKTGKRG